MLKNREHRERSCSYKGVVQHALCFNRTTELFANPGNDLARGSDNVGIEPAQHLLLVGCLGAKFLDHGRCEFEVGIDVLASRRHEIDRASFLPHDVLVAQLVHRQQHPECIDHRGKIAVELAA